MSHPQPDTGDGPAGRGREEGDQEPQSPAERRVDEERREIERGVYERRTTYDKDADTAEDQGEGVEANPGTYEPSTQQVNRGREQGLGVGQKDIDYQRDPTRIPSAEQRGGKQ